MLRKTAAVGALAVVCLALFAGAVCWAQGGSTLRPSSVQVGSPQGGAEIQKADSLEVMIGYLKSQRLPALRDASEWENDFGPGLKLTTVHYEVFTTLLDPLMLVQVPGFVESAYREYNNQLPKPIETTTKFTIYLFANRKQWEDFTRKFAGNYAEMYTQLKAGAYYMNGSCVAYFIGRERTFSVLGHEGWHQFNSRHFKYRLPSWIDEGVAMQFEVSREEKGLFYFEPGQNLSRLGSLKKTIVENNVIPLRALLAINPGEVLATANDDSVSAFYCQAYALVRFLREEEYGRRLSSFHNLLLDGLDGRWEIGSINEKIAADRNIPLTTPWNQEVGPRLFEKYIDTDFGKIEKEYLLFCKKIVYHISYQ